MVLSIRTTYSGKSNFSDDNILGWSGNQGLKNQIKAVPRSQYTTRRDKVGMTQIAENESRKRIEELSGHDQYGGVIRNTNQTRGKDPMRTIDYTGSSTGTSAPVGLPLGKNNPVSSVKLNEGIERETIRGKSEPINRQSVHNIKQEQTNKSHFRYSLVNNIDLDTVIKENMLHTSVQPTRVYLRKDLPSNFGTQIKTKNPINVLGNTSTNRLNKFEYQKAHQLNSELTNNRINIHGNSGVKTLSKFKGDNILPTLQSRTKIEELYSNKSNSLKHFSANSTKQTDSLISNRVKVSHVKPPIIEKDTSMKLNKNVNLKHKINTSNMSFDPKPTYKTQLNYQS